MSILNCNKLICLLWLVTALFWGRLSAQVNPVDVSLQFGFPDVLLKAVAMDSLQVTYLATNHGLYTYNGSSLRAIDIAGLETESISAMCLSGDTLWFGHSTGALSIVSIQSARIINHFSLSEEPVQKLLKISGANLLVATAGAGIMVVNKFKVTTQVIDELSDSYVNDMAYNQYRNILALATDRGVDFLSYDAKSRKLEWQKQIAPENDLYRGVNWRGDTLLISRDNSGLNSFIFGEQNHFSPVGHFKFADKIYSGFGEQWVADRQWGLCNITFSLPEAQSCFELPKEPGIIQVFQLREGYLIAWLSNGNYRLLTVNYQVYEKIEGSVFQGISAILSAPDNTLWVAVKSGLYQLDNLSGSSVSIKRFIPMPKNSIFPVIRLALQNNKLLAGSLGDGLYVFNLDNNAPIFHFNNNNGLDNSSVLDLVVDKEIVWISTLSGVQQLNLNSSPNFKTLPGAPGYVYDLMVPAHKKLYASSQGESVFKEENGRLSSIDNSIYPDVSIVSMVASENGAVWGLSVDSELFQINDDELKWYEGNRALSNLGVYEILSVKSNKPALISTDAIYLANHQSVFYEAFWLSGIFDSEYQHIAVTDSLGNFWIASKKGLVRLHNRVGLNSNHPFVSLQKVLANHIPASMEQNFTFSPSETDISLVISAPWYDPFRPLTHEYRLIGLDTIWRTAINPELFFPKLAPGKYKLQVRSKFVNSGAVIDAFEHSFSIALPFYNRTWFYIAVTLVILLIIIYLIRYRERRNTQLLRAETERVQGQFEVLKNQINPHFLFNSFNTLAAMIGSDPLKAEEYTEKLSAFFRQILSVQQNDVVLLQRELELAADFIYLQRSRYGDSLQYEVSVPEQYLRQKMPVLALQILLENAIKHNTFSKSKPLIIKILVANNNLVVSNNLQARVNLPDSTGVGLTNLTNRMRILFNKELLVEKTDDTFSVIIPL
jgi:ligand-binding sensor domain-containing protein